MANDAQNARCALREATAALKTATDRHPARDHGIDKAELVADLAAHLEALAALVRTAGLVEPIPTTPTSHNVQAVVQGITATAAMARRVASHDGQSPASQLTRRMSVAPDD